MSMMSMSDEQPTRNVVSSDSRFELKTLKFVRDRFVIKLYDTQNKKGSQVEVYIPEECRRVPTRHFSYVSLGQHMLMSGG